MMLPALTENPMYLDYSKWNMLDKNSKAQCGIIWFVFW